MQPFAFGNVQDAGLPACSHRAWAARVAAPGDGAPPSAPGQRPSRCRADNSPSGPSVGIEPDERVMLRRGIVNKQFDGRSRGVLGNILRLPVLTAARPCLQPGFHFEMPVLLTRDRPRAPGLFFRLSVHLKLHRKRAFDTCCDKFGIFGLTPEGSKLGGGSGSVRSRTSVSPPAVGRALACGHLGKP